MQKMPRAVSSNLEHTRPHPHAVLNNNPVLPGKLRITRREDAPLETDVPSGHGARALEVGILDNDRIILGVVWVIAGRSGSDDAVPAEEDAEPVFGFEFALIREQLASPPVHAPELASGQNRRV